MALFAGHTKITIKIDTQQIVFGFIPARPFEIAFSDKSDMENANKNL
jgi:hypothetical protein